MTQRYGDASLVQIGDAKAQLLVGQPSTAWGAETSIEIRCVDTTYEPASHWYGILTDYAEFAGADAFGRLDGGEPWVRDASQSSWPRDSNVVRVETGANVYEVEDVWALLTAVGDDSTILGPGVSYTAVDYGAEPYGATRYGSEFEPSGNDYRMEISYVPLAPLGDYDDRTALLTDLATPTIQL